MEYLKKYWYLIPLLALVCYIAYVVLTARTRMAAQMEKVREAKAEKKVVEDALKESDNAG